MLGAAEQAIGPLQLLARERLFVRGAGFGSERAKQLPRRIVAQRLHEDGRTARPQHAVDLPDGRLVVQVVKDGAAEHDVE